MEEIIDLIATNSSPSEISDAIKNSLYTKAAEKLDSLRPVVATSLFDGEDQDTEYGEE